MKKNYVVPRIKIRRNVAAGIFCVSTAALNPIREEDAGFDWDDEN